METNELIIETKFLLLTKSNEVIHILNSVKERFPKPSENLSIVFLL